MPRTSGPGIGIVWAAVHTITLPETCVLDATRESPLEWKVSHMVGIEDQAIKIVLVVRHTTTHLVRRVTGVRSKSHRAYRW